MENYIGANSSRKENLPDIVLYALYWLWFLWTDLQAVVGEVDLSKQCYSLTSNGYFNGQWKHVQFHPAHVRYVVALLLACCVCYFVGLCYVRFFSAFTFVFLTFMFVHIFVGFIFACYVC